MLPLGVASIVFFITSNSTLQLAARPDMRGRVMALYGMVFLGSTPIAAPLVGWVGEHLGPRVGLAGGGVIGAATGVVGLWAIARRREAELSALEARPAEIDPDEHALSA